MTMSKIGKKIMQSYFIIILATAFVFMGISKMSFNDILNRQTRLDLKKDADVVAKQINMVIDQKIEMTVVDGSPNVKIQISKNFFGENAEIIQISFLGVTEKLVFEFPEFKVINSGEIFTVPEFF